MNRTISCRFNYRQSQ